MLLTGELFFDETHKGTLLFWTNKSWHYRVGEHLTEKTKIQNNFSKTAWKYGLRYEIKNSINRYPPSLPPMEKFKIWDSEI